jgi:hypothetical protein
MHAGAGVKRLGDVTAVSLAVIGTGGRPANVTVFMELGDEVMTGMAVVTTTAGALVGQLACGDIVGSKIWVVMSEEHRAGPTAMVSHPTRGSHSAFTGLSSMASSIEPVPLGEKQK